VCGKTARTVRTGAPYPDGLVLSHARLGRGSTSAPCAGSLLSTMSVAGRHAAPLPRCHTAEPVAWRAWHATVVPSPRWRTSPASGRTSGGTSPSPRASSPLASASRALHRRGSGRVPWPWGVDATLGATVVSEQIAKRWHSSERSIRRARHRVEPRPVSEWLESDAVEVAGVHGRLHVLEATEFAGTACAAWSQRERLERASACGWEGPSATASPCA